MRAVGLFCFFAAFVLATHAAAQTQAENVLPPYRSAAKAARLDPGKLQWYDRWVTQYPNDSPPDLETQDPEELKLIDAGIAAEQERIASIRKDPEILPYLKAIFWLHHRAPDNNATGGVKSILEAMILKPELTEADVADITAEFDRILATPFSGNYGDSHNYLLAYYAGTIIRRFPTPANEERCVKIIERSDSINWRFPKLWTLRVLAEIGSKDTLPVAERTLKWMEEKAVNTLKGGVAEEGAMESRKLVESMRKRLSEDRSPSMTRPNPDPPASSKSLDPTGGAAPNPISNPVMILALLSALPVLLLLLRKKAKS